MITGIINRLSILPRWIIIIIDSAIVALSTILGFLLRFNFDVAEILKFKPVVGVGVTVGSALAATLITKSYAGIVRYTGIEDSIRIIYTVTLSAFMVSLGNLLYHYNYDHNLIPFSVVFITFLAAFIFLFYYRLLVKNIFSFYKSELNKSNHVAIFGAGHLGVITKQVIDNDPSSNFKVVAFFEHDLRKVGKDINGTKIYNIETDFDKIVKQNNIKELIISIRELSLSRKNEIVDLCQRRQVKVRTVPSVEKWVKGELSFKQIKEINIEELLGRESIVINNSKVISEFSKKVICITGAAGSIGSEIVRQIIKCNPSMLLLIDQAETPLYELECQVRQNYPQAKVLACLADITNEHRIRNIFQEYKPEIVFHAAAYKHVPMMESNASEAIICNVMGTKLLADISVSVGVKRFVMISTDKAVNPTNVMGCSKRIAEMYVQSLNKQIELLHGISPTVFVTTRFGNVLGSNGSVIPLFKKQIQERVAVTVTHPEITRYFMTIPEACELVLEAAIMGRGGEIFIFDMGNPVRIADLARKMIWLSGLELGKDIDIVFTGLREGEKLFEELLADRENTIVTHHEKIMKAKVAEYPYQKISQMIGLFEELLVDRNEHKIVAAMKEIVPEFRSNFSRFEVLDS